MKGKRVFVASAILAFSLTSCGEDISSIFEEKYTVIWQNENGDILEIDRGVKDGETPSYDSAIPVKDSKGKYAYTFSGWEPSVGPIHENTSYTALYEESPRTFTVTWKNYDDSVLEIDENVAYGAMPSFDGLTPSRKAEDDVTYSFIGWSPKIAPVKEDIEYIAQFTENHIQDLPGRYPVLSSDGNFVTYGVYPTSHEKDEEVINALETTIEPLSMGYSVYGDALYVKETAHVYNNEKYEFDDGTQIENVSAYWFKCEPIEWRIIKNEGGVVDLLSTKLLDAHNFYDDYATRVGADNITYANNYEKSSIRSWLNGYFYDLAFVLDYDYIQAVTIDNSASSTGEESNKYACGNTTDKVYLLSHEDYLDVSYGFASNSEETSSTRHCKTTDYARARGAWSNTRDAALKNNGSYWTRSPSPNYSYCAYNVNAGGYISEYAVDGNSHSVRPSISIKLTK